MTTETNAERLERIKSFHEWSKKNHVAGNVGVDNVEWLLVQAERAQKLEETLNYTQSQLTTIRGMNRQHDNEITGLCIQIQRALAGDPDD